MHPFWGRLAKVCFALLIFKCIEKILLIIKRTFNYLSTFRTNMSVNFCCFTAAMSEEFLTLSL